MRCADVRDFFRIHSPGGFGRGQSGHYADPLPGTPSLVWPLCSNTYVRHADNRVEIKRCQWEGPGCGVFDSEKFDQFSYEYEPGCHYGYGGCVEEPSWHRCPEVSRRTDTTGGEFLFG